MTENDPIEQANEVLSRAFEGGYFERWEGLVWKRAARDEIRAAASELLGPLAEGVAVRVRTRSRDVYRDRKSMPTDDWDLAKDARLTAVYVVAAPKRS